MRFQETIRQVVIKNRIERGIEQDEQWIAIQIAANDMSVSLKIIFGL